MTPEEMRVLIEAAPTPGDGLGIYERVEAGDLTTEEGYETSAASLAKALLIVAEADPTLLDVSAERECDPSGWEAANNEKLWEAAKERFPGLDDWLGGITGFQFGWAHNSVRYVLGAPPTGNPAIVSIGE